MKQRKLGMLLVMAIALISLTFYFFGCGSSGDDGGGGNGPTTSKFVVVANTWAGNLSVYKIKSNGTLDFVDNVTQSLGTDPSMVLLHPNKLFLYVVNHDGYISTFSYNSDNGALTETEGSPVLTPDNGLDTTEPINMAITPDGKFLYVTDQGDFQVHIYGVDNTTGDLTYSESVNVVDVHSVAMHPTGNFVFIGTESEEIWAYAINTDNGSLTAVEGTPYISPSSATWVWLQTDPEGLYLFAAGQDLGAVLSIDNVTGGLTELAFTGTGSWFPKSLVVAPTIPFVYTANWDNNSIGAFKLNYSDSTIDNVAHMPFAAGPTPKSVTITEDSKYLYVANFASDPTLTPKADVGSIWAYSVNHSSGALSRIGKYDIGLAAGPKFITTLP